MLNSKWSSGHPWKWLLKWKRLILNTFNINNEQITTKILLILKEKFNNSLFIYTFIPRAINDSLEDWQRFGTLLSYQLTVLSAHVHGRVHLWDTWGDNRHHMFLIPIYEIEEFIQNKPFYTVRWQNERYLLLVLVNSSNLTLGSYGGSRQCKAGSQPSW